jgi:hypothetical protein
LEIPWLGAVHPDRPCAIYARTGDGRQSHLPTAHKVENAKQTRVVGPQANKVESGFSSKCRKFVWRIFVRILGYDFFRAMEMKLMFIEMHKLIHFTDQMHLNSAGVGIVDCAVPPLIQIEVCAQFAIDAL